MTQQQTPGNVKIPELRVPGADFRDFVDRALDGIRVVVTQLGDDHVNRRPSPSTNTPFGLVTHVIGVIGYWGGTLITGRPSDRDRDAEFLATGTVAELLAALDAAQAQLHADLTQAQSDADPLIPPNPVFQGPEINLTQGGTLLHMYEELAQHHGQLESLRDALLATERVPLFEPPLSWLRAKQGVKWRRPGPDLLPAWVADMDFPVAPVVRQSVLEVLDRGDLGYPDWPQRLDPLAEPFARRMQQRFGWAAEPAHVRGITDLLAGLQILIDLTTEPGDGVVMQEPNYPPFRATVPTMKRRAVPLPVELEDGVWRHDFDRVDAQGAKILLVVNPHNPTGTAFGAEELQRLADFALRHDLLVISDEIHADLVHEPNQHIPFASLSPEIAERTVTLTSATKAFNIAGLRTAVAHIGSAPVRELWDAQPPDIHGVANVLGVEATRAAWEQGDDWLAGVRQHLLGRRDQVVSAAQDMPGVSLRVPDATYLAWLDCSGAALGEDAGRFFRREARVRVSPGPDYGGGPDWVRLNFAASTAVLRQITEQMATALKSR